MPPLCDREADSSPHRYGHPLEALSDVDLFYGRHYRDLYQRHWWWRARESAILHELGRIKPPQGWPRILDVGCGDGLLFDRLSTFGAVEGVEPDATLLDPNGPWRHAIHAVPFDTSFRPAHHVDLILMLDVLEHLQDPAAALRHAIDLLQPSGTMLITVPAFQWLWTHHDDINHHVRRYDRRSFRALAREAGFRIRKERYLFQWTVPAKLLVRAIERLNRRAPAVPRTPPAPVNALLRELTSLEERISRAVPVPFGTSLLIIGGGNPPAK